MHAEELPKEAQRLQLGRSVVSLGACRLSDDVQVASPLTYFEKNDVSHLYYELMLFRALYLYPLI